MMHGNLLIREGTLTHQMNIINALNKVHLICDRMDDAESWIYSIRASLSRRASPSGPGRLVSGGSSDLGDPLSLHFEH